jgi:hypothetical protein
MSPLVGEPLLSRDQNALDNVMGIQLYGSEVSSGLGIHGYRAYPVEGFNRGAWGLDWWRGWVGYGESLHYSERRLVTGLVRAALTERQVTVSIAMPKVDAMAAAKMVQVRIIRYWKLCSQCAIT